MNLIQYLSIKADYEIFEAMSSMTLFLFGVSAFISRNAGAWSTPAYKYISLFFTPYSLAWALTLCGILGLCTLRNGNLKLRLTAAIFIGFVWLFLFGVFAIAFPPRSISPFFLAFVLMHIVLIGRLISDYKLGKLPWTHKQ